MKIPVRLLRYALYLVLAGALLGALGLGVAYWLIAPRLPSVEALKDVRMQVPLRVYSTEGKLIATFGETHRKPVKIENVPDRVKLAFLAAEDANFYQHPGVDWQGTLRAGLHVIFSGGGKSQGGSTITQQVARNFFLSPEKSYTRKLSEIFLAFRIESALTKDEILELYLNKIFLGHRSYGVAAAAEFYYGKTLSELNLAECAMLASLPKFPSTGNPLYNRARSVERRNYVLGRMLDNHFIDKAAHDQAIATPELAFAHESPIEVNAPYVAEMVRREAIDRLGNTALTDGYVVRTTIDAAMQEAANQAVRNDLMAYDQRHGYRGAEAHVELTPDATPDDWNRLLADYNSTAGLAPGLVTRSGPKSALVYLDDGQSVPLDLDAMSWARAYVSENRRGPAPKSVAEVLKVGDIVRLGRDAKGNWQLSQVPKAQAALVALNPEDGAIEALVGGFSFVRSKFNRATMNARGPGSGFKPFLYSAAFEHGFTPASVVNDAPLVFPDPSQPNGLWAPQNDDGKFSGPMRLREALVKSVNLVSVRLLDAIGVRYAREYATRFGFRLDQIPNNLSMALGTASVSPMDMARGYTVFANGGFLIDPYVVSTIMDRDGNVVYQADPAVACRNCPERALADAGNAPPPPATTDAGDASVPAADAGGALNPIASAQATAVPATRPVGQPHLAPRAIDMRNAYLITSLMRDVIRRGTGSAAMELKRTDLAGKTGSTNDFRDAWFSGFNPDLVASCWVGLDDFGSLGHGEFGAKAALPIWIDFMREALKNIPVEHFDMPPGITTARIDPATGLLAPASQSGAILEVFKVEDVARLAAQSNPSRQNNEQREAYDVF
ncbi:MAG TPA: penicillin-binding protein 1A [Rhodanobacteraceae bacterium]|nr:penicillin-binding protein 1A [Rhodanobacteraceae bacterium]